MLPPTAGSQRRKTATLPTTADGVGSVRGGVGPGMEGWQNGGDERGGGGVRAKEDQERASESCCARTPGRASNSSAGVQLTSRPP